jgi:uncharacterized protein (DUF1800 family)
MGEASAGEEAAMAIGPKHAEAVTAFNRFGFGARPGDLDAAAGDPRGLLLEELWTADVALIRDPVPPSGLMAFEAYYLDQQKQRAARMKIAMAASPTASTPTAAAAQVAVTRMAAPPPGDPTALTKTADLSAAPTAPLSAMTPPRRGLQAPSPWRPMKASR